MADYIEEILKGTTTVAPVWDDNVWDALQGKEFGKAGVFLKEVLSAMSAEEWGYVYWMGIIKGIPAFRGEALDQIIWKDKALPKIGEAIIMAATPIKLSSAYASVGADELLSFHSFLMAMIPETALEKRISWLKNNQLPLLGFFLSNPLGLHLSPSSDFLNSKNISRLKTLPADLKAPLFSAQTSEIIRKISEQNNVPEIKIPIVADVAGLVFLGFTHPEEIEQEIGVKTGLAQPIAKAIAISLISRLFSPLGATLDRIYAPLPHEEAPAPKMIEEIKRPEAAPPTAVSSVPTVPSSSTASFASFGNATPAPAPTLPVVKLAQENKPAPPPPAIKPAPLPANQPAPSASSGQAPAPKGTLGEFARRGLDRLMGKSTDKSSAAAPANEPLPKIIQEEATAKPALRSGLNMPMPPVPKFSEIKADKKIFPLRPTVIEIGNETPKQSAPPEPIIKMPMSPPAAPDINSKTNSKREAPVRIVHYSESRTPLAVPKNDMKQTTPNFSATPPATPIIIPAPPKPTTQSANVPPPPLPTSPTPPKTNLPPAPLSPNAPAPSRIEQAALNLSSRVAPPPTPAAPQKPPVPPEIKRTNQNP